MALNAQSITILGSTGSIGVSALDVIGRHPERYQLFALTAKSSVDALTEQCVRFNPYVAVMQSSKDAAELEKRLRAKQLTTTVLHGSDALEQVASANEVDTVVAAIVGAAGLLPTLSAAGSGKRLLLANKEALVMSGDLLMRKVKQSGAMILPLDSEHNAIFQCLRIDEKGLRDPDDRYGLRKIWLTASGGPFRNYTKKQLSVVSKQQALMHPNWEMGPKISIDSATMMNKGLEVIEACHLFDIKPELIQVVVHPESVVHSMVSYNDGSVLAQLGRPDMRTPIAHALAWPDRIESGVAPLDLFEVGQLNFEKPDQKTFPCLGFAYDALQAGGTAPVVLNAANEVAVAHFLAESVSFLQLSEIVDASLNRINIETAVDLDTILSADKQARQLAHNIVAELQ